MSCSVPRCSICGFVRQVHPFCFACNNQLLAQLSSINSSTDEDERSRPRLAAGDYVLLETYLAQGLVTDPYTAALMRKKLRAAQVYLSTELTAEIVRIGSYVTYRIRGEAKDQRRKLVLGSEEFHAGRSLRVTAAFGLALLGMSRGQKLVAPLPDGFPITVSIEQVGLIEEQAVRVLSSSPASAYGVLEGAKPTEQASGVILPLRRPANTESGGGGYDPDPTAA